MTTKPLPPHKAKPLIETFKKQSASLEVYEAKDLSLQSLKELSQTAPAWLVREKSKWT